MTTRAMQPYVTPHSTQLTAIYLGLHFSGIVILQKRGTETTDVDLIGISDQKELADQ